MIEIHARGTISTPAATAVALLRDVAQAVEYWGYGARLRSGDVFSFYPLYPVPVPQIEYRLVLADATAVTFEYVRGPFRGTSVWTFHEVTGGTEVVCVVNLEPPNCVISWLARTWLFRARHIRDIRCVIRGLEQHAAISSR